VKVPVEVVRAGDVSPDVRHSARGACACVILGEARIYVARSYRAHQLADADRLEAMKLAPKHEDAASNTPSDELVAVVRGFSLASTAGLKPG
jgi:hypothetical protein